MAGLSPSLLVLKIPVAKLYKDNVWLEEYDCKENLLGVVFYPEPVLKQNFVMISRYLVNLQVLSFIRNRESVLEFV